MRFLNVLLTLFLINIVFGFNIASAFNLKLEGVMIHDTNSNLPYFVDNLGEGGDTCRFQLIPKNYYGNFESVAASKIRVGQEFYIKIDIKKESQTCLKGLLEILKRVYIVSSL